jgi:hypothetical protein
MAKPMKRKHPGKSGEKPETQAFRRSRRTARYYLRSMAAVVKLRF